MSNKKILKWIIAIIVIIILLLTILLLINNSKNNSQEESNWIDTTVNNDGIYPEAEDLKYEELEIVDDADDFATVYNYIKEYINYFQDREEAKINNLTDIQFKEKNTIDMKQFENTEKFILNSAYSENEKLTITRYYVFGINKKYINEKFTYTNMAFIVRCDYDNMTVSIIPINNITEDNIQQIRSNNKYIVNDITENEDNVLNFSVMDEQDLINLYIDKYIYNCLNNSVYAYNNLLNEEYRNQRFENIEEYKTYLQLNKQKINNFVQINCEKKECDEYNKYIVEDSFINNYVIIEKGFMDYTIMLDNYRIIDEELKEKYNKLNNYSKAHNCTEMFINMINNKDYEYAYSKLEDAFKNSNFRNISEFKNYVNENFFEDNIAEVEKVTNIEDKYIVSVRIKSGISSTAETIEKKITVTLGEDMNFTISM